MFILPYRSGSQSARDLSRALGAKRIKRRNSRFKPRASKTLINWGCGEDNFPAGYGLCQVLNDPSAVSVASNKLLFFKCLADAGVTPEFTEDREEVIETLDDSDSVLWVARTLLRAHSGRGIELIKGNSDDVVHAPLYTKYVKKQQEYRVHVFDGEVIDTQRKARSRDVPDDQVNWQVRNHSNGFIFARNEDHEVPEDVVRKALVTVDTLGLDFGAVDVAYNSRSNCAYVLEVNTAPGLTGTTLDNYVEAFRGY